MMLKQVQGISQVINWWLWISPIAKHIHFPQVAFILIYLEADSEDPLVDGGPMNRRNEADIHGFIDIG